MPEIFKADESRVGPCGALTGLQQFNISECPNEGYWFPDMQMHLCEYHSIALRRIRELASNKKLRF